MAEGLHGVFGYSEQVRPVERRLFTGEPFAKDCRMAG